MAQTKFRIRTIFISAVFLALSGCSLLHGYQASSEVKLAVVNVTNEYIRLTVMGRESRVEEMVLWFTYVQNRQISREQFRAENAKIRDRWAPDDHPLLGLTLVDLKISEDHAVVRLKKASLPDLPEITVTLEWNGAGWLVIDDSIHGKNGAIAALLKTAEKS